MKRGIYLVANLKSQKMCENLIYSIRQSGCSLPIRLIHFGGKRIRSSYIQNEAEVLDYENFSTEAKQLIVSIQSVLPDNRPGLLYRYLAWFSDWDEFIYSDNDVVALFNWNKLFEHLNDYDFVHGDEEYITNGKFDYHKPDMLKKIFGGNCLQTALTSGHIVVKPNKQMVKDLYRAVEWFRSNPDIPKKNDQAFMHIASMLGNWKKLNLCQPPYNWLSPWAGDYKNSLQIIQKIQTGNIISHIHYSGDIPKGDRAIEELLFSRNDDWQRLRKMALISLKKLSGLSFLSLQKKRAQRLVITVKNKMLGA